MIERVDNILGSTHKLERLADADGQAVLCDLMADKSIFIADGHHRYETALTYQREVRATRLDVPAETPLASDYILVTLTAFEDEGLLVLPTHRLVRGVAPEKIAALPGALTEFTLTDSALESIEGEIAAQAAEGRTAFGVILSPNIVHLAVLNGDAPQSGQTRAAERLPAAQLGALIFDQCLGIDAAKVAAGGAVSYTRDVAKAASAVSRGDAQAAFLLSRPTVKQIEEVSLAGDVMPQKSTFFFPKLLSGLVLRDLRLDQSVLDTPSEMTP